MKEAIDVLASYGHTKIAFIGEALTVSKLNFFKNAMEEKGLQQYITIENKERFEKAGVDGVKQLLSISEDFTAIICAYDNIAFGAIKELKTRGFNVPKDISVIGIDNISSAEYAETSLTSIGVNPSDICSIAWDLICKKLKNKYFRINQNIVVKSQLIIRESIAQAKHNSDTSCES